MSSDSHNLIAPTGPVSLLSDVLILVFWSERRSPHNLPNADIVSTVCDFISLTLIRIAVTKGNLIITPERSSPFPAEKAIPSMQLSLGQVPFTVVDFPFLMYVIEKSPPMFFLSTVLRFRPFTWVSFICVMISPDAIPNDSDNEPELTSLTITCFSSMRFLISSLIYH